MTDINRDYVNLLQKVAQNVQDELAKFEDTDYTDRVGRYGLSQILVDLEDMYLKLAKQRRDLEMPETQIGPVVNTPVIKT